jgi:two-component system heavy metal sensor histidine kinase CusS
MPLRKIRPISLTLRVLLFVSIAIGLSLFLTASLVMTSVKQHFIEQDSAELRVITQSIVSVLKQSNDRTQLQNALSHAVSGHHSVYYQVESNQTSLLYHSNNTDFTQTTESLKPSQSFDIDSLRTWKSDGKSYRGAITTASENGVIYRITAAVDMGFHLQFLDEFRKKLWLIMLGAGIATVFITWLGIRQGHLPLKGLSNSMREIETHHLNVRIDTAAVPIELLELAQSFNHMIGRLEEGFERLSHFSSDIAHELRTPLTNLITQTQVTLSKTRESDTYRELIYSNLEELERLTKMVSDMLWLAKCDNNLIKPVLEPLDLTLELSELFDFFEALAEEKHIVLLLEGPPANIMGDRSLLRRALSNLLSNAIRHTPHGETIIVKLETPDNNRVSITITNPGINIPCEHLSRLFDRFYRVDPSRQQQSEGAGLGLAITKSIIESHGGSICAHSDNHTVSFCIVLPLQNKSRKSAML